MSTQAVITTAAVASAIGAAYIIHRKTHAPEVLPDLPEHTASQSLWGLLLFGPKPGHEDAASSMVNGQPQKFLHNLAKRGRIVRYNIFGMPIINVTDAALVRMILADPDNFPKAPFVRDGVRMVADALFTLEGPKWATHRKAMSPAFDQRHLQLVTDSTVRKVKEIFALWGDSDDVEVRDSISRITLDVLGLVMYSYEFNCTRNHEAEAMKAITVLFDTLAQSFRYPRIVWRFHPLRRAFHESRDQICRTITEALARKNVERSQSKQPGRPQDMIDILTSGGKLTEEEIMDEMIGLYFAGYETAAATFTFALFHTITRPEVLAKAREEVQTVIGDGDPTLAQINRLQYIDGIVKESLRFNPTVNATSRSNMEDFEHKGMTFSKGQNFQLAFCCTLMDPEYFEDPGAFRPERWETARDWLVPGSFTPFLDGPHRCIGEKMAMLEVKTTLAMMIRQYDFEVLPDQDLEPYYRITVQFKNGLHVRPILRADRA